jgi:hypothetical protein
VRIGIIVQPSMHSRLCTAIAAVCLVSCGNTTVINIAVQPDATTDGASTFDAPAGSETSTTPSDGAAPLGEDANPAPDDATMPNDASAPSDASDMDDASGPSDASAPVDAAPSDAGAPDDASTPNDASIPNDAAPQAIPEVWCTPLLSTTTYGCNVASVSVPGIRIDYGDAGSFCELGRSDGDAGCTGSCGVHFADGGSSLPGFCTTRDGGPLTPPICALSSCPACNYLLAKCCAGPNVCGCDNGSACTVNEGDGSFFP